MTTRPRLPSPMRRLIALARLLIVLGAAMVTLLPPLLWLNPAWIDGALATAAGLGGARLQPDRSVQFLGIASALPLVVLSLAALWQLWRLFDEYARGRALGRQALAHLRRFAWLWLVVVLAQPMLRAAWSVLLTLHNPPGQRMLVLQFQSADYLHLLVGAVLLAVAHVMHDAVVAVEENQGFV